MPQEQRAQRKEKQNPSGRSWLSRVFGSESLSPETLQAIEIAKKEAPDLAPVEPFGFLSRLLKSNAQAYASPGQTIYVNPTQLQGQSVQDIADTLIHEQEHVKQARTSGKGSVGEFMRQIYSGIGTPYHQREDELAAFQAEKNRRSRMGRAGTTATPSFLTGQYTAPYNVHLVGPQGRKNANK